MKLELNCTGARRKELVKAISEIIGAPAEYQFMPTQAYKIAYYTVDKYGNLDIPDNADSKEVEMLFEGLKDGGFLPEIDETAEQEQTEESEQPEEEIPDEKMESTEGSDKLTVEMAAELFDERIFNNLDQILKNRHDLICHALKTDNLEYHIVDGKVQFPWFTVESDIDAPVYCDFVTALFRMAKEQKRINSKTCETDNEKYTMRCFLLRMGFIGKEHKAVRMVLLRNLSGSSAFRNGRPEDNGND